MPSESGDIVSQCIYDISYDELRHSVRFTIEGVAGHLGCIITLVLLGGVATIKPEGVRKMGTRYVMQWQGFGSVPAQEYTCGFCGVSVAPALGWFAIKPATAQRIGSIYICHHCQAPTFIDPGGRQFPGSPCGDEVSDISDKNIADLYEEARRATAASAYTAAVLCCRKVLMHVAVERGAEAGKPFVTYVEHLADAGYIPPGAKGWVDHIRKKSNEANHEIVVMSNADAEELLSFTGMLLKVIYEFPAAMQRKTAQNSPPLTQ